LKFRIDLFNRIVAGVTSKETDITLMAASFRSLCDYIAGIRRTRGSNAKIKMCADFLSELRTLDDVRLAAQFIGEGAFSAISDRKASIGSRTAGLAASSFCEIDYDVVFKPCRTATGSNSETIGRLMENIPAAVSKREPQDITLKEAEEWFIRLGEVSSRDDKARILHEMWARMTPAEIVYSIRMMGQGSLRIGFETRSLVSAIAKAFQADREEVRFVHMITGSIGRTAELAHQGKLEEAGFKMFHPLSFMLASPIESRAVEDISGYLAEEKFDGMRAQVHADGDKVELFSRDLNRISPSFPEITDYFGTAEFSSTVLDGEICVFKDDRIMPFQMLQKRMGIKKPGKKVLNEYPVLFIAFDVLAYGGQTVFERPLKKRRELLGEISEKHGVPVTAQFVLNGEEDVEKLFKRAVHHGNEGLMLKKKHSSYEYGQRGKSWLKVKKPGGSFDTVIMYAHAGSGRRGGLYSDFTLGISVKDDERYEEEFIPIGKAYGGYTDKELKQLNREIKNLAVERYGPTLGLKPGIVVEIEFDDIQVNKRTKAGYTLRLPRFRAIRWDLGPSDADTLRDVEKAFEQKMERDRLPQSVNPSFIISNR
jgi:DNA ligase-1